MNSPQIHVRQNFCVCVGATSPTAGYSQGKQRISRCAFGNPHWHKDLFFLSWKGLFCRDAVFLRLRIPSVPSAALWRSRFCAKAQPCVMVQVEVARCAVPSGIRGGLLLARRGGRASPWVRCWWGDAERWEAPRRWGRVGTVCARRDIKQSGHTVRD